MTRATGRATAPAAGTVLNALATGHGVAFAVDLTVTATVDLDADRGGVAGTVGAVPAVGDGTGDGPGASDVDASLVERCVELTVDRYGDRADRPAFRPDGDEDRPGGAVRTDSEVPVAAGLKSSSAAANATVLATLDALGVTVADGGRGVEAGDADPAATDRTTGGEDRPDDPAGDDPAGDGGESTGGGDGEPVDPLAACRLGVRAAREVGVTVTGAFDDASASMLGGVTHTDNGEDELLDRGTFPAGTAALAWVPPERAYSAAADVDRCRRVAGMAELVRELAADGRYAEAMTVNGLAFSAALNYPTDPAVEALPDAAGVSLSGTGPAVVAVGERSALREVQDRWDGRSGRTWLTTTRTTGARRR